MDPAILASHRQNSTIGTIGKRPDFLGAMRRQLPNQASLNRVEQANGSICHAGRQSLSVHVRGQAETDVSGKADPLHKMVVACVPDSDGPIDAAATQPSTIDAIAHIEDLRRVGVDGAGFFTVVDVQKANGTARTTCSQRAAVRTDGESQIDAGETGDRVQRPVIVQLPDANGTIGGSRDQRLTIGGECDGEHNIKGVSKYGTA